MVLYAAAMFAAVYLAVRVRVFDLTDVVVTGLVGWCALSLLWTPDRGAGGIEAQKIATLAVLFLAFRRLRIEWWGLALAVLIVLGLITFVPSGWLGVAFPEGGFRNDNALAGFLLVAVPLLLWRRTPLTVAAGLLALIFVLFYSDSKLGWAVLCAGALLGGSYWAVKAYRWPALGVVAVLLSAVAVVALDRVPEVRWSVLDRMHLAAGTAAMWADAPLTGIGAGSFLHSWPEYSATDNRMLGGLPFLDSQDGERYAEAAHNEYLQILSSYGLVGFALFCVVVFLARGRDRGAFLSLGALAILAAGDYALQRPGTAALGMMALATISPVGAPLRFPRLATWALIPAAVVGMFLGVQHARAQFWYGATTHFLEEAPDYLTAFKTNLRAYEIYPADPIIRLQLFRSMATAFVDQKLTIEQGAADRLFTISKSAIPEDRGLLISRIAFLGAAGRCGTECDAILRTLRTNEPRLHLLTRLERVIEETRVRD